MSFFSKAFKKITKPLNLTLGFATGGLANELFDLWGREKSKTPTVDFSETTDALTGEAEDLKKKRLKLLKTSGGYLGEEVTTLGNTRRNLFGN